MNHDTPYNQHCQLPCKPAGGWATAKEVDVRHTGV
jgi:hypothetical protein